MELIIFACDLQMTFYAVLAPIEPSTRPNIDHLKNVVSQTFENIEYPLCPWRGGWIQTGKLDHCSKDFRTVSVNPLLGRQWPVEVFLLWSIDIKMPQLEQRLQIPLKQEFKKNIWKKKLKNQAHNNLSLQPLRELHPPWVTGYARRL